VHAYCHVTGGGIVGNLPRVLAKGQIASIKMNHERPAVFRLIQRNGPVNEAEMLRTFNLGIGLVCVVAADAVELALDTLRDGGETVWPLGQIIAAESAEAAPKVRIEEV
jgi:phosphoribosylformylglycinamidine cyclo-ligase